MTITFRPNRDGTFDCYVVVGKLDTEFASDFMHGEKGQSLLGLIRRSRLAVRTIRFVLAGSLVLAIPFAAAAAGRSDARYAMSYVYFGSAQTQIKNVLRSKDALSVVSPSYFDLNPDGSLKQNNISRDFITAMHDNGIRVVPFLSNHWDRQSGVNALSDIERLVSQIVDTIWEYNLDGVNIDIENVTEKQRDLYTQLVRRLRESLPAEKEVSVAVAANPNGWNTGWHGSYDYKELGRYADHLFIMAYDEHYQGGSAGPVASYDFVRKSIEYALNENVPADKIVLGIPFFGRVWNSAGSVKGTGISLSQIDTLISLYGGTVSYDEEARSPKLEFVISQGDPSYTLVGKVLPPGRYEVWFENSDSIKEKLSLVGKYGLKGSGNWSAGQESPDVWEYYELWLNGKYFSDIGSHFAKDDIIRITADGIMKGVSASEFAPLAPLTRAQAAVILTRLLSLPQGGSAYPDTAGHWAEAEISAATAAGLFEGYDDNTFRPEAAVTREEIAVLLARILAAEEQGRAAVSFPDVAEGRWSYQEITSLAELGIVSGYDDGLFLPERAVNRGEMAVLVNRTRAHLSE